jgi:putative endonuclease
MFYVYILHCSESDRYYVGHSSDVHRRLEEHNHPVENKKFTAKYTNWELVTFFQVSENRGDAIRVEKFIKKQKSKVFIIKLIAEKGNEIYITTLIKNVLKKVRAIPKTRD